MAGKTAAITSIGCKVNKYEADAMAESLKSAGYEIVEFKDKASVYVINTCTVTNTGDKKSRQLIRKAKNTNKDAIVVVAGCYSQTSPEEVSAIEEADIVIGAGGSIDIAALVESFILKGKEKLVDVKDINKVNSFKSLRLTEQRNRVRAYVKIEDGCDNFCAYCIIPYARGRVRSRPVKEVLDEVKELCQKGAKEIVLTGIHVASYGKDLGNTSLEELIKAAHQEPLLQRIRLSSLEPNIITDGFIGSLNKLNKLCDYFHLSLQSGCGKVLKDMNRKYTPQRFLEAVETIRLGFPNSAIWSDVIVGFPGETDDDFDETYHFIKKSGVNKLHIFPYSPKKGTKAFDMENQISDKVKFNRAEKLQELDQTLYKEFLLSNIGRQEMVLFEKKGQDGYYYGHTKNSIMVKAKSPKDIKNEIIKVKLADTLGRSVVLGEITQ